ncbi:MAG: DEAD/DEAH box helicase [Thermovirgaceae bacterium]
MNETGTALFEGIGTELAQRLGKRGFTGFTPVQEEVLQLEDHKKDMIVRAKTGSGKTLAFLLPLYDEGRLQKGSARVVILSPTRELAQQTAKEAKWLASGQDIETATLVGGMDMSTQIRDLRKGASVIVGTPGRTLDHLKRGTLDVSAVHTVILDEGDQMLDMGFREELEAILESAKSRERTWLFSATMPPEMRRLLKKYLTEPRFLSLVEEGQQHSEIRHKVYQVPQRKKIEGLINVLLWENPEKGLIFCHTKAETGDISRRLAEEGFAARCLHGDMTQRERNTTLSAFRNGHIALLVATNVAARGLDVPEIEKVIQFGLPDDMETFTHRSGRTGRAGEEGENIVVLCPRDAAKFRGMIRRTAVEAEWLKVPDGEEIKRKHRLKRQRNFTGEDGAEPAEDIRDWARRLLEEESPEMLVSRLLEQIDKNMPGGYELKEELERDLSRKNTQKRNFETSAPKRQKRMSRSSCTAVKLGLLSSKDWNVGRVLSGICNALDVSSKDVAKIDIQGDSAKVELMPEALGKFRADSRSLQKWGFTKEDVSGSGNRKAFLGQGKREQRRTVKNRRDKQRTY